VTKKYAGLITVLLLACLALAGYTYLRAPKTYSECILENIKNVESGYGARMVADACEAAFRKPIVNPYEFLDSDQSWEEFKALTE
jgi:uncharacterized iron-regulated membrane protein